jgi:hypothetical protein
LCRHLIDNERSESGEGAAENDEAWVQEIYQGDKRLPDERGGVGDDTCRDGVSVRGTGEQFFD